MHSEPALSDPITDELQLLRKKVPGVRGSIIATADGLLIAHDMQGLEPTQIAALVAATHAVAVRASLSTACGPLKEVITRGSDGYLAVYAAGSTAVLAALGTSELNVAMLNFQARQASARIAGHTASLGRGPEGGSPAGPAPSGQHREAHEDGNPLPTRQP